MREAPLYKAIIQEELAQRCEKNPRYSMRAFAKALGVGSGALSEILSGKRVPSHKLARQLVSALGLTPSQEREFFRSLAEFQNSRGLRRLSPVFRKLRAAPVEPQALELSIDLF